MSELQLPSNLTIAFPEGKDKLTHFEIVLRPDEGIYRCARWEPAWASIAARSAHAMAGHRA